MGLGISGELPFICRHEKEEIVSITQILEVLAQADQKLDTISVKSVDAYTMVDARKLLRVAYDELRKEAEVTNVSEPE